MHVVKEENDLIETLFGTIKVKAYSYSIRLLDKRIVNSLNPRLRSYKAEFLGGDANRDTAVMRIVDIDSKDYESLRIGDSLQVNTADDIFALGAPHGLYDSFSCPGVVSKTHRLVDVWFIEDFIQVTLPTHPGNSGSPVFNNKGEVIGMIDLGMSNSDSLGFAIPTHLIDIKRLKSLKGAVIKKLNWGADVLLENFVFTGTPENLDISDLNVISEKTGLPKDKTLHAIARITDTHWAILTEVKEGSIAEKAGFKKGDVITKVIRKIDVTKEIFTGMELRIAIADIPADEEFEMAYERVDSEGRINNHTTKIKLP